MINTEPLDPKNTLIVDSLNLAFRWKHNGTFYGFQNDFIATVRSLAKSYDCGKIIILGDGGNTWRTSKFPSYKKDRKEKLKHRNRHEIEEDEAFFDEYAKLLEQAAEKENIWVFKFSGVEADDLATYITENKYKFDINDIWLISTDRDWDLLINEDVSRFSTITREEITWFNWPYPVSKEVYADWQVLKGDQDVPGVYGIGPVKAAELINKYGSIFDLYCSLPLPGNAKYIRNLNENKENLLLYYELMDFVEYHEEAIGEHLEEFDEKLSRIYNS